MNVIILWLLQLPSLIFSGESTQPHDTTLSLSTPAQYSLTLGSYLQGLGETLTPPVVPAASVGAVAGAADVMPGQGLINSTEAETVAEHSLHGRLLQMVTVSHVVKK